ncbi:MAG TPA: ATP-dependent helicase, partial [Anaerolineae bacterium]|nr:ATP-dependent helicase [Anaerolineae bacterium]
MNSHTEHSETQDAARIWPGPVLLLAGPGTGKTYQLARRVKWLVEEREVLPEHITVITFTDEAMRKMRERLTDPEKSEVYVPLARQPSRMSTMHSLGFHIVREHSELLGFTDHPTVLSRHVVTLILGDAAQLLGLPRDVGEDKAGKCRSMGRCDPIAARDECRVCQRYQQILSGHNMLDYDDQILLACKLLRENDQILALYQEAATHLLVDEYQDINAAQFELISLLARRDPRGLYAAGDDNQSIYGFRGGTPDYIRSFDEHWPNATTERLGKSRRCPQAVLDVAAAVITHGCSDVHNDPQLGTNKTEARAPVTVNEVSGQSHEGFLIAQQIAEMRGAREALILIPRSNYAGPIKRALRQFGLPYDCTTGIDKTGLHIMNELARWFAYPQDNFALRVLLERIIANPEVHPDLGKSSQQSLAQWRHDMLAHVSQLWAVAERRRWSLFAVLKNIPQDSPLRPV